MKRTIAFLVTLFQPEVKNPSIILLGDSLVKLGNWKTLLNRDDLINRGVGGETLSQIQERISDLGNIGAKIVFIEGGINDLPQSGIDSLFAQYQEITNFFLSRQVIPIVISLVYIAPEAGKKYPWRSNWPGINHQVAILNENLKTFCTTQQIDFVDLNSLLSDSGQLRAEYTTDGVHLTRSAYHIWAGELLRILRQHQI